MRQLVESKHHLEGTMIRAVSGSAAAVAAAAARAGPLRAVVASKGLSSLVPLDEEYMG